MSRAVTITRQRLIDALAQALKTQADAPGPSPYFSRLGGRNDVILDGAFDLAAVVEAALPLIAVEATQSPKAWLVRAENGNVRLWTSGPDGTRAMRSAAQWGSSATALYDHPALSPVTPEGFVLMPKKPSRKLVNDLASEWCYTTEEAMESYLGLLDIAHKHGLKGSDPVAYEEDAASVAPPVTGALVEADADRLRDFADQMLADSANVCTNPDGDPEDLMSVRVTGAEGSKIAEAIHRLLAAQKAEG